jgi:uncharacterized protein YcaQ
MFRKITIAEARLLALQSQRLAQVSSLKNKDDALQVIEHLGYIQIDTLAVVERAHHHTLWSRLSAYKMQWLDELLREKKIFEYWSHAASYLPMRDYRFSLIRKHDYAKGKSHWFDQDKKIKRRVLARIKREGPLQSKDFESTEEAQRTWYYWKPAKRALEQLFMEGKLMVSHRQGFQKVYDLAERILPSDIDTRRPSKMEFAQFLVQSSVRSHGIVTDKEIHYQRGPWNELVGRALRKSLREGVIIPVKVEGHEQTHFYADRELVDQVTALAFSPNTHILSPFDNLLIQRKRTQRLFNFDYTIECYLPEHKRKFGYFTLPVLYGDRFIARIDPKADRENKVFYIRNLSFEAGLKNDDEIISSFASKLREFMKFNGCTAIIMEKSNNKTLQLKLKKLLKQEFHRKKI